MPVTIKSNLVKIRDNPNAAYTSMDVISDSTTAERIQQITNAANTAQTQITSTVNTVQTQITNAANTAQTQIENKKNAALNSIPSDYTTLSNAVTAEVTAREAADDELKIAFALFQENIPGTVQTIAFDSAGNVQSITHMEGTTAVRTDVFTFAASTITEVRTLASGESLTIVTNTDTLETTTTYADAE